MFKSFNKSDAEGRKSSSRSYYPGWRDTGSFSRLGQGYVFPMLSGPISDLTHHTLRVTLSDVNAP